jgi:hypothetical protein
MDMLFLIGKFEEKLQSGALTLERTQNWLRDSIKKIAPPPTKVANKISLDDILVKAVMDIVIDADDLLMATSAFTKKKELTPVTTPETLLMDVDRLRAYQAEFTYAVSFTTSIVRINHIIGQVSYYYCCCYF